MPSSLDHLCRQPDRSTRSTAPRRRRLCLGDLVAMLHERALERGMSEADAAAATARGVATALSRSPDRRRLIGELCAS